MSMDVPASKSSIEASDKISKGSKLTGRCSICLQEYFSVAMEDHEKEVIVGMQCFQRQCIVEWLEIHQTPWCRFEMPS